MAEPPPLHNTPDFKQRFPDKYRKKKVHVQEIKTRMLFGSRQENVYLFFWSSPRWLDASNLTRYPQSQGLTPFQEHAKILNLSGPNCLFISLGPQASCSGLRTFVFIIFLTSKQGSQDLHFSRESNDIRVLISWIVRLPLVYRENADSDLGCFEEEADPPWPTTCVCACFTLFAAPLCVKQPVPLTAPPLRNGTPFQSAVCLCTVGWGAAEHPCFRLAVSRIRLFLAAGGAAHVIPGHCRTPWL